MGFQEQEEAGMQPDPEFKAWFATEWKRLIEAVEVPGMKYASWDRKAAYIAWVLLNDQTTSNESVYYLLGLPDPEAVPPQPPKPIEWDKVPAVPGDYKPPTWVTGLEAQALAAYGAAALDDLRATVGKMTPEARQAWLEGDWRDPLTGTQWDVNHDETDACPDYPEGVVSGFDSAKW
jgi:hypothetical protein